MVTMPEFQPGQRVRVREEGGNPTYPPDKSLLGKEATIKYGTATWEAGPANAYWVEFDGGEVFAITGDWLASRGDS